MFPIVVCFCLGLAGFIREYAVKRVGESSAYR
jgi:hypothetical protein